MEDQIPNIHETQNGYYAPCPVCFGEPYLDVVTRLYAIGPDIAGKLICDRCDEIRSWLRVGL